MDAAIEHLLPAAAICPGFDAPRPPALPFCEPLADLLPRMRQTIASRCADGGIWGCSCWSASCLHARAHGDRL